MVFQQSYPFDIKKFPDDDDILLTESDLKRKNVLYCRKEILKQMQCTQWAKDEYLQAALDPGDHMEWFHYHLQKCYTPYMDAVGCVVHVADKEVQTLKREAGPEGWKIIRDKFVQDAARTTGETNAQMMWEMATNMKEIHQKTRQRDGHLFGEQPQAANNNHHQATRRRPANLTVAEAMGVSEYMHKNAPSTKKSHLEVEEMFRFAKEQEMKQQMKDTETKKSFWRFGF